MSTRYFSDMSWEGEVRIISGRYKLVHGRGTRTGKTLGLIRGPAPRHTCSEGVSAHHGGSEALLLVQGRVPAQATEQA